MGARSYIMGQLASDIQSGVDSLNSWQSRVIQTQYRNTSEILSNKINEDLENKVYSNPNTDKWEDSSNEVFNDNLSYIDSLENVRDETKNLLREDLNNRKLLYQNTVKSQMENTNIANWQAETNESINLNASNSEKSLTDCVEDYSKNLNSTKILLDKRGLDYLSVNEVAENIIPKKSEQYISNSLNNLPNNFLKEETDLNGNTVYKAITSDSISDDVISGIENEMSKITRTDWKMPDSQKADIKSTTVKLYDQKLTVLNTAATNNSKIYAGEIEENINKGVLTDTASMESYYKDNYPPFIVNTVGKEIINYAKSTNDELKLNQLMDKGFVNITQYDIDNLETEESKKNAVIQITSYKVFDAINKGASVDDFDKLLSDTKFDIQDEYKGQILNILISEYASAGYETDEKDNSLQALKELVSDKISKASVVHQNNLKQFDFAVASFSKLDRNTPEEGDTTKKNKLDKNTIMNVFSDEEVRNFATALSNGYPYNKAKAKGLLSENVLEEDYDNLYQDFVKNRLDGTTTESGRLAAHAIQYDPNLTDGLRKSKLLELHNSGDLSLSDANKYSTKPKSLDTSKLDQTLKMVDQVIDETFKDTYSSAERTKLKEQALGFLEDEINENYAELSSNPEKTWENLKINIETLIRDLTYSNSLKNLTDIGNSFGEYREFEDIRNQLNDTNVDTFVDEVQQGKWDFFLDNNVLDEVGSLSNFIIEDEKFDKENLQKAVINNLFGDVEFDDLSQLQKAKVLVNSDYIMAVNSQSSLFKKTFDKPNSKPIRIGNRYAFEVEKGIYAYLSNSDTTKPISKGDYDNFREETSSTWHLFKPNIINTDSKGDPVYDLDNQNYIPVILSNLSTKNTLSNITKLGNRATHSKNEYDKYIEKNGDNPRDHYLATRKGNYIRDIQTFDKENKNYNNQLQQIADAIQQIKHQGGGK